ncbi:MAG: V-type ATP synthase subunit K [Planctomycetota bacterium]
MDGFWQAYFVHSGAGWAVLGAMLAVMFGGWGSAKGIRIAAGQAAGVLSEKPELFGRLFALMVLPGTQGFYGLIVAILIAVQTQMLGGALDISTLEPIKGVGLLAVGFCAGVVLWRSAVNQGEASASAVNLTSRRPEQFGRSLLMPALVETYAAVAVLASILFIQAIVGMQVGAAEAAEQGAEAAKTLATAVSP